MDEFVTEESRKQLIISVQQHPVLYDRSMESYHSKAARYHAWVEVAKMCGRPGRGNLLHSSTEVDYQPNGPTILITGFQQSWKILVE